MATSENQGLQIVLGFFVFFTILFMVFTFVFYRSGQTLQEQSQKDRQDAETATTALRQAEGEMASLKELIGAEPSAKVEELAQQKEADMQAFAGTFPPEKQNYKAALEYLVTTLRESQANLADEKVVSTGLAERNEQREDNMGKLVAERQAEVDKLGQELGAATAKYAEDRERLEREKAELAQLKATAEEDLKTVRAQHAADVKSLNDDIARKETLITELQEKLRELTHETFSTADGRIVDVNQRRGVVWINLGSEDSLRRQIKFSVYGADEHNVNRVKRKGSIEVLEIIGSHMAEARIIDDMLTDPILPGDQIYTPLWHTGRMERFALAGFMDIDGDRISDRKAIHEMITMSGGHIDAEVDDEGKRTGELSIDTRFLVIGAESPTDTVNKALGEIQAEALTLGIERITLAKFLDHVGWKDNKSLLQYGVTEPGRFSPRPPDGGVPTSSGNVSERFRQRPPRSKPAGAP